MDINNLSSPASSYSSNYQPQIASPEITDSLKLDIMRFAPTHPVPSFRNRTVQEIQNPARIRLTIPRIQKTIGKNNTTQKLTLNIRNKDKLSYNEVYSFLRTLPALRQLQVKADNEIYKNKQYIEEFLFLAINEEFETTKNPATINNRIEEFSHQIINLDWIDNQDIPVPNVILDILTAIGSHCTSVPRSTLEKIKSHISFKTQAIKAAENNLNARRLTLNIGNKPGLTPDETYILLRTFPALTKLTIEAVDPNQAAAASIEEFLLLAIDAEFATTEDLNTVSARIQEFDHRIATVNYTQNKHPLIPGSITNILNAVASHCTHLQVLIYPEHQEIAAGDLTRIAQNNPNLNKFGVDAEQAISQEDLNTLSHHCQNLTELTLHSSNLTHEQMSQIATNNPRLTLISLARSNNITDNTIQHIIDACPYLNDLELSECQGLTPAFLDYILEHKQSDENLNYDVFSEYGHNLENVSAIGCFTSDEADIEAPNYISVDDLDDYEEQFNNIGIRLEY